MSDPNFSFAEQKRERESSRRRLEPPPRRKTGPGWRVTGAGEPEPARWEIKPLDTKAGTVTITEAGAPRNFGPCMSDPSTHRSRFTFAIKVDCFIGGHHVPAGSICHCWHGTASGLLGDHPVIEEVKNFV